MPQPQDKSPTQAGRALFIGAGPGDPELITLRGKRLLGEADIVLYDYLASEALLEHAPSHAEAICLGRHGEGKIWKQEEICARIVAEARAGKTVARLKGGDPSIFGRLAEELAACRAADVPCEIAPGVTTASAAAAYAGFTLTDRSSSSSVTFVTGHECTTKEANAGLDFASLAATPGTLVVYMGVTNAPLWSQELIRGGKPADTPVLIIRKCSLPDQKIISCTLGKVPDVLAPGAIRPPLVVVIGDVARGDNLTDWFTARPLFGKTVLVTRPRDQAAPMAQRLTDLGARVLLQPTLEIGPPDDLAKVDAVIDRLSQFDLVAFSSRNGVDWFLRRMHKKECDARSFGSAKIGAIGPATAEALTAWRLRADYQPDEYRAEALAELLADQAKDARVLLVRASRGREVLAETLSAAGATVEQVVAYSSRDVSAADEAILLELKRGGVDWITLTSSAIARSTMHLLGPRKAWEGARIAAISPLTAETLREEGVEADAVATEYTADGVIEAILRAEA